jgi:hypothetical protein
MKSVLAALVLAAAVLGGSAPASAEVNYPWCLIQGGREASGAWSCGYVSLDQCMASRVATDVCLQNPRYAPSPQPRRRR